MPDEQPFRFAISPVVTERHARTLIDVLAGFAGGTTSEELRRRFEQVTGLRRQMFYDSLKFAKHRHWVIGGGVNRPYELIQAAVGSFLHPLESPLENLPLENL